MKKVFFILACTLMVVATATCFADDGCRNRDIGIGVKGGYGMLTGADDDPDNGFEERAEGWGMGNFLLRKAIDQKQHWSLGLKVGYGLNYDKDSKAYRTNLVPVDLNLIYTFLPDETASPYLSAGFGIIDWDANYRPNEPDLEGERDPAFCGGLGVEIFLTDVIALDINGTYRYMLTDDKDLIGRSYRDDGLVSNDNQLWFIGAGLTWYPRPGKDSDGDGVCDKNDKCPDTPRCCVVDEDGCPVDSDGDGVCDGCDKCPDTAKGMKVDKDGCAALPDLSELEGITFRFDDSNVIPAPNPVLNRAIEILQAYPDAKVEIHGHTDWVGSEEYNMKLGLRRAEAVKKYILAHDGVKEENLITKSFGESKPIATNDTKEGRAKNRRVEFHLAK
jgi:outer membrane protein OmpA-like peptidoglycan-associated protein/opacity protein-like surface antigen